MRRSWPVPWAILLVFALVVSGCTPSGDGKSAPTATAASRAVSNAASVLLASPSPTPQPTATPITYGPDQTHFPSGVNPLTGQPASDPELLKVPALLVSVSHFPPTARPQAGLSFAPFVYEFSITTGESRFLAVFYGQYPAPEVPLSGNCDARSGVFEQTSTLLGNRVWLDQNGNGIQDPDEPGIPGICVHLLDASGNLLQSTATDSNGYYGFNVQAGQTYSIRFVKPDFLDFTRQNVGDESHDSDADPSTGQTENIRVNQDDLLWDAGLKPNPQALQITPDPDRMPKPEVGPVRSGRLLYAYIGAFYQDSCLFDAFASQEVLPLIPHCAFVTHEVSGGGSMLEIDRMKAVAEENQRNTASRPFNYTSNLYSDLPPSGGKPASQLNVFFASLNQSGWRYDPLYQAYLRYVDTADKNARGVLHADVDRLTGRQLHFENVIVLMADTDVVSPTNIDIHLDQGNSGYAYLFRDGLMFPIRWSTKAGDYEKQTGFRRPIQFVNRDGSPAALKPGHTWVIIVTPFSPLTEQKPGQYLVVYSAPEGEER